MNKLIAVILDDLKKSIREHLAILFELMGLEGSISLKQVQDFIDIQKEDYKHKEIDKEDYDYNMKHAQAVKRFMKRNEVDIVAESYRA